MFQKGYIAQICEVQQNGRFSLFSSKFPSNIYSILFVYETSFYDKMLSFSSIEFSIIEF